MIRKAGRLWAQLAAVSLLLRSPQSTKKGGCSDGPAHREPGNLLAGQGERWKLGSKHMRAGGSSTARSWLNGSNTCQAPQAHCLVPGMAGRQASSGRGISALVALCDRAEDGTDAQGKAWRTFTRR